MSVDKRIISEFSNNDLVTDILRSNFTGFSTNPVNINYTFRHHPSEQAYSIEKLFLYIDVITIVCLYIQMVFTVILNLIVVCYILLTRSFSPINILILNLVISDLFYAGGIPFYVRQFMPSPVSQTESGCRLSLLIDWISMIVNVFTIAALTIERYSCLKEKKLISENDRSKLGLIIGFVVFLWTFALVFSLPKVLSIESTYHNETKEYACGSSLNAFSQQAYTLGIWFVAFVFPYSIIIVFSILLIKFLRQWSKNVKKMFAKDNDKKVKDAIKAVGSKNQLDVVEHQTTLNESNDPITVDETSRLAQTEVSIVIEKNELYQKKKSRFFKCQLNLQKAFNITPDSSPPTQVKTRLKSKPNPPKGNSKTNRVMLIKKRSTRFVLIIAISFLVTWSPLWILQTILIFSSYESPILKIMNNLTLVLCYINGLMMPLVFMILTQNFRDNIKNFFRNLKGG